MEQIEKLAKVVRYAGLNLNPQVLSVILDDNVVTLVKTLNKRLEETPNLDTDSIDVIVADIQAAAEATAKAAEAKKKLADSGKKAKKPALDKK